MESTRYRTVDEYIISQPQPTREMLEQLRIIIWTAAPRAEEVLYYRIPCYKYHGLLVGMGVRKNGCSFYAVSSNAVRALAKEKNLKISGNTIHFKHGEKLPVQLLKKIIKLRMLENKEAMGRKNSKS